MEHTGIFIVIEGTDGSGKGTQFKLLKERLEREGYDVATFDFPQYEQPSSHFVRRYLNGDYGGLDEVGPYTASLFYALDRYEAAPAIREALKAGKIVLSNRFTGSSMGHQGTKFSNAQERRGYFIWLDNLEFEMLHIPRPDMSFVLRVPADIAQTLIDQKETRGYTDKKRDLHEADLNHLEQSVAVFDDLTQLFPKDFQRVDCVRDNQLLPIEAVQELIWQKVLPLLPEPPAKPAQPALAAGSTVVETAPAPAPAGKEPAQPAAGSAFYTPDYWPKEVQEHYQQEIGKILAAHGQMAKALVTHLMSGPAPTEQSADAWRQALQIQAYAAVESVVPVAVESSDTPIFIAKPYRPDAAIAQLAAEHLPANHASPVGLAQLTDCWPRNEIDLAADMLYSSATQPLRDIRDEIAAWPYNRKLDVFEAYATAFLHTPGQTGSTFQKAHYSWDILCEYRTFRQLHHFPAEALEQQPLTPRFGYEVPKLIEEAGLSEQFEDCFDRSLALYSYLQSNGQAVDAQYATLQGHRMRWKATYNAQQFFVLHALLENPAAGPDVKQLIQALHQSLQQAHPLLAEICDVVSTKKA